MEFHPVANLLPMLDKEKLNELAEDIKANGLLHPGYVYNGMLIDGRNRYKACDLSGVDFKYIEYKGDDPIGFVLSLNLRRRHLDQWDRAALGAKLVPMYKEYGKEAMSKGGKKSKVGVPEGTQKIGEANKHDNESVDKAARDAGTNRQYVQDRINLEKGANKDETVKAILDAGNSKKLNMPAAKELLKMKPEERKEVLSSDEPIAKAIKKQKAKASRSERIDNLSKINQGNKELSKDKKYNIIYADPPWSYEHSISTSRDIENQYPTMSIFDICSLPVCDIAEDNALLLLWATPPMLYKAMKVIDAWGFEYVTSAVWDKELIGMGYFFRQQHEHLLVAKKGDIPTPKTENRKTSVHREKRGKHSQKPTYYYELIESWYSELSKIELFSREPRTGWDSWGNQSGTKK